MYCELVIGLWYCVFGFNRFKLKGELYFVYYFINNSRIQFCAGWFNELQCLVLRIKTATESYLISIGLSLLLILERKDGHCLNLMSYLRCFVLMSLCCCFKYFCLSFNWHSDYLLHFEIVSVFLILGLGSEWLRKLYFKLKLMNIIN